MPYVDSDTVNISGTSVNIDPASLTGLSAGDIIVVGAATDTTHTLDDAAAEGWIEDGTQDASGTDSSLSFVMRVYDPIGDPGPWTLTFSASELGIAVFAAYSGRDTTNPLAVAAAASSGTGTAQTSATIDTTGIDGCDIIHILGQDPTAGANATPDTSPVANEREDAINGTSGWIYLQDYEQATGGSINLLATLSASDNTADWILALRPAPPSGPPLLDDFERSDESPLTAPWLETGYTDASPFDLVGGAIYGLGGALAQRYDETYEPDVTVRVIMRTGEELDVTDGRGGATIGLNIRGTGVSYPTDTVCYYCEAIYLGGAASISGAIGKYNFADGGGGFTELTTTELIAEPEWVGGVEFQAEGTTLTMRVMTAPGVWEDFLQVTDSSITNSGGIAISRIGGDGNDDDWYGIEAVYLEGTVYTPPPPSVAKTLAALGVG